MRKVHAGTALHRPSLIELVLNVRMRDACRIATEDAVQFGRAFTPIYWYYSDDGDGPGPILTMWDMNEPEVVWVHLTTY